MTATTYWEPSAIAPLAVGETVRIRLSGECPSWIHSGQDCRCGEDGDLGVLEAFHDTELRGAAGHRYRVMFPTTGQPDGCCSTLFARIELERVP